jgi:hypothetical protein
MFATATIRAKAEDTPYRSVWLVLLLFVVAAIAGLIYTFVRTKDPKPPDPTEQLAPPPHQPTTPTPAPPTQPTRPPAPPTPPPAAAPTPTAPH